MRQEAIHYVYHENRDNMFNDKEQIENNNNK